MITLTVGKNNNIDTVIFKETVRFDDSAKNYAYLGITISRCYDNMDGRLQMKKKVDQSAKIFFGVKQSCEIDKVRKWFEIPVVLIRKGFDTLKRSLSII